MKLETEIEGLLAIWRPYQIHIIEILLSVKNYRFSSGEVWKKTNARLGPDDSISRASVIIFLNGLVQDGIADYTEETGKGGYRKMYKMIPETRTELTDQIVDKFLFQLYKIFPEHEKLKELLK